MLELLGSELKSSEQMKLRSREDLEEIKNSMDFEEELVRGTCRNPGCGQNLTTTLIFQQTQYYKDSFLLSLVATIEITTDSYRFQWQLPIDCTLFPLWLVEHN